MNAAITRTEIAELLSGIADGTLTITAERSFADVFAGNLEVVVSNGWRVVFFVDCDDLDYVDSVSAPDGRTIGNGEEDWIEPHEDGVSSYWRNPLDDMSNEASAALEQVLRAARPSVICL